MMLNRCRSGSAVLIVVLTLSMIMLSCFNLWRHTALNMDMVLKRQEREQKYRITEGVLHYGIALCKNHFKKIDKRHKKKKIELRVGMWRLKGHPPYGGKLIITPHENMTHLEASLRVLRSFSEKGMAKNSSVFAMSCSLERKTAAKGSVTKKDIFVIHNWKVHA